MTARRPYVSLSPVVATLGVLVSLVLPLSAGAQFVYVNNNVVGTNTVSAFSVAPDGTLTPIGTPVPTGGGGGYTTNIGAATVVAVGQRLYATNSLTNSVAAFDINANGSLTAVPGSPFPTLGTRPNAIVTDGSHLFVTNVLSNNVSVFSIATNGALTLSPSVPVAVASSPLGAAIDTGNSRLFLSHGTTIGVYTIGIGGSLTSVGTYSAGTTGMRGVALDSSGAYVYGASSGTNDVAAFSVGLGGALSTISTYGAGSGPTDALVHPTIPVLYVANDQSSNVSAFTIGVGGTLSAVTGSPFAAGSNGTAGLAIDPAGRRLFAVNGGTNASPGRTVSVFDISTTDGTLTAVGSPVATGDSTGAPSSIAVVGVCPSAPLAGCLTAGKAKLQIKNNSTDAKDQLKWGWTNGAATTQADFGLPVLTRTYALCLYDDNELVLTASVAGDQLCAGVPCWKLSGTTGIKFKDKSAASYGVTGISAKAGVAGKSKLSLQAKGANVPDAALPFSSGTITAQFITSDSPVCFTSAFSGAQIKKNDGTQFSAKAP